MFKKTYILEIIIVKITSRRKQILPYLFSSFLYSYIEYEILLINKYIEKMIYKVL